MLVIWMPYPNMRMSVHVLSSHMLGAQMADCVRVLRMIAGHRGGGRDLYHSTTLSWWNHPSALTMYTDFVVRELILRGINRGFLSPRSSEGRKIYDIPDEWSSDTPEIPEWIGTERIHASNRATLLKKDPAWYAQFSWSERPRSSVEWPGKMPGPGDSVIGPGDEVRLVHSLDSKRRPVLVTDGRLVPVERSEFYNKVWRRCVVVF